MDKLFSHLWPNYVYSMTQILKCFNPNDSCSFDSRDKKIKPETLSFLEQKKGKPTNGWNENHPKLNKSDNMPKDINNPFTDSEDFLLVSIGDNGGILSGGLEGLLAFESSRRDRFGVEINRDGGEEQSVS
jgi:hypothetical protein